MAINVAIDTGGTFTDLVARRPDGVPIRLKVPSTPDNPARAIEQAMAKLVHRLDSTGCEASISELRHGTTVATNALLERRGAKVGLVTTAGFEDLLRLRRQTRPELYALHPQIPPPLVEPGMCVGVVGRLDPNGREVEPLEPLGPWLEREHHRLVGAEAFAVCLLHAYACPDHEAAVAKLLRETFAGRPVVASHELAPLSREFERASTVAVNAYVAPVMATYLARLQDAMAPTELRVMDSGGGLMPVARAAREPVHTVLSGPAGGVRGAWEAGVRVGRRRLLTFDMGGTSTDVSVVSGELQPDDEGEIAEHPLRIPLLPIETVGAGGGSIAYVDDGGVVRVGPRSAGSVPGPAAYGKAGPSAEPTVTDAHVVLGRLPELLGGAMPLDVEAARAAVQRLASRLGTTLAETARGIIEVASANMSRALKRVSMERGIDPRGLTLVAFGGAGGLHACELAEELGCPEVLFPAEPGVLSAEGIAMAPAQSSASQSLFSDETAWQAEELRRAITGVWDEALEDLESETGRVLDADAEVQALLDCRYRGQSFTLPLSLTRVFPNSEDQRAAVQAQATELPSRLRRAFDALHSERYGYALPASRPVELVAVRAFARLVQNWQEDCSLKVVCQRHGPESISTYSSTLWLPPGWKAEELASGDTLCRRITEQPKQPDNATTNKTAQPLALEVHRQRLTAIAEEMGAALMRASFSANIKERRDFSCAIFDGRGRMLVHAAHVPVHLGSTPMSVAAAIAAVPMEPGSTVILNDPYAGGTHLPDVTLVSPVFLPCRDSDRRKGPAFPGSPASPAFPAFPAFYVANRAHHADVGGVTPGSMPSPGAFGSPRESLSIDDEGLRLGPTLLCEEVRETFARASRTPEERFGDLRAQEGANTVGLQRLVELASELGMGLVADLNEALLSYAERRMRCVLVDLADGAYRFEDRLDGDGFAEEPIPIPVTVHVQGGSATVDFTEAPDAVPGSVNAVRAITSSAVLYAFRCLAGESIPANEGLMRPITVLTRPGSIVDAMSPAAVSAGNVETSQRVVDAVLGALALAAPGQIPAASTGSMNNVLFGGIDSRPGPRQGNAFVHYETLGGGAGASPIGPGADAIHVHMTNTLNTPVEELERAFPVRIERYCVRPARPRAANVHSGGSGVVRAYRFLCPASVTLVTERRVIPPYGSNGAPAGEMGRNSLHDSRGNNTELPGKVTFEVVAGDTVVVETAGGGSFGF